MNGPIDTVEDAPNASAKRKLVSPDDARHVIKRRAARACQSCRTRKVRCDIVVSQGRCTNCKLDNLECILLSSKRGKNDTTQKENTDWLPPVSPASTRDTNVAPPAIINEARQESAIPSLPITTVTDDVPVCLTFDDEDMHDMTEPHMGPSNGFNTPEAGESTVVGHFRSQDNSQTETFAHGRIGALPQPLSAASASESTFTGCYTSDSSMENDLPSFIKPLPTNIDPEDLKYLARKGAFMVPAADLRAEILRSYVFTVYPFMPILDLKEFVDIVLNPDSGGKVSLLLFQAVMFAGLSSLKQEVIQHTGCKTLKQARKTFFTKVLSLYDLGIERQDTVVLQSLLLMSLWYEKWDDRKHTWHWTGLALSLAQSMGLNRGAGSANLPPKVRRLRRRIWWSLYIRDRLIALGTRRSMRIKDEDYDMPLLAIEDFDIEPLNGPFGAPSNGWLMGRDANQSRGLTLMCIELSRLCICIGHVLQSQYTTLGERSPLTSTLMVVPKSPYERAKELTNRDDELEQWYQGLDPQLQNVAHDSPRDPSTNSLEIHWSILQVIHQTAVSILHRPQILEPCPSGSEGAQAQHLSRGKVGNAARKITKIMHAMLRRDQVRFLPTSGLSALLSASLGHMLEIKSNDENLRDASIFRFYQTMQVLQRLREIYAAADSAVSFLASAVRKAGISAPIQLASQTTPSFMIATTRKETLGAVALPEPGLTSDPVPTQRPASMDTIIHLQENQTNQHGAYAGSTRQTGSEIAQASTLPDKSSGNIHDLMGFQTEGTLTHGSAANALNGARGGAFPSSGTYYDTEFNMSFHDMESQHPRELGAAALPDPLLHWVVNEEFFHLNSSLDHVMSEEPMGFNYDICADAFGLLDSLVIETNETDTITVNRSNAD